MGNCTTARVDFDFRNAVDRLEKLEKGPEDCLVLTVR
jgi:hypothetical protein